MSILTLTENFFSIILTRIDPLFVQYGISETGNATSNCLNSTGLVSDKSSVDSLLEIPIKEVIIVTMMLSLWIYSIVLTKRAWKQFLRD